MSRQLRSQSSSSQSFTVWRKKRPMLYRQPVKLQKPSRSRSISQVLPSVLPSALSSNKTSSSPMKRGTS